MTNPEEHLVVATQLSEMALHKVTAGGKRRFDAIPHVEAARDRYGVACFPVEAANIIVHRLPAPHGSPRDAALNRQRAFSKVSPRPADGMAVQSQAVSRLTLK